MLRDAREGGPMFKDSQGDEGDSRWEEEESGCGSDEHEEHGENTTHTTKDKGCFAHTGDQTGPTQPHGEFRRGETLSPEGGLELHDEV